jgi:DMSO/TMAO reductase YedYZ molybdopterin-dependent catalytic subunit
MIMIEHALPPGQVRLNGTPPRFGLDAFLHRAIEVPADWRLTIRGDVEAPLHLGLDELVGRFRIQRTLDLHCVTTWTATGLGWSGVSFADVWERLIVPR